MKNRAEWRARINELETELALMESSKKYPQTDEPIDGLEDTIVVE